MTDTALTPRERGLRRWLIAAAIAVGVLIILILAIVLYWMRFVLPTEPAQVQCPAFPNFFRGKI